MKKTILFIVALPLVIGAFTMSCGTGKKLEASRAKVSELQQDNTLVHRQLNECSIQVEGLRKEKASAQTDLKALSAESKMTIADQAKRLRNFQDMVREQNKAMDNLKSSISDALVNFKSDELNVYTQDGKVYVALSEKLLFKSGSDVVDTKGKEALKSLAGVLNTTNGITVLIEGHTDNVPMKSSRFKDNWDLSTARAVSIVRILTTDNGFDSKRISASGKGEFSPIATNKTNEGRASNRRTEVILSPDLTELYAVIDK